MILEFALIGIAAFVLGLAVGIIAEYLNDTRYINEARARYKRDLAECNKRIAYQKESIDRLLEINNKLQANNIMPLDYPNTNIKGEKANV